MPFISTLSKLLTRVTEHPLTRLALGISLAGTGLDDLLDDLAAGGSATDLDVHHGAIILGVFHMLSALGDLLEGVEAVGNAITREKA